MNPKIHLRGLVLAILGLGATFLLLASQQALGTNRIYFSAAPGVIGIIGLLELISGYPFYKIAQKWDAMPVLVRFGLGLVIIALVVVGMFVGANLFYSQT